MKPSAHKYRDRKGSVLIVTLILGSAIALALGSFMAVTINTVRMSQRSFYANSSLNLAEAGLEEALYALNTGDWTGWSTHSSGADNRFRAVGPFNLGQQASGDIAIVVFNATTSPTPTIVAQGESAPSSGAVIVKQLEVKVRRRSHWATGVVAKENVKFSGGNVYVDSYSSCDPTYSTGGAYDPSKHRDRGSVASARVVSEVGVDVGNSDVWGYVSTSGADVDVGPNGTVRGEDTPGGVKKDPSRITKDFPGAGFELEEAPTSFDSIYTDISGTATLGTAGTSTTIKAANMLNTNGNTIEVYGDVTLYVTNKVDLKGDFFVRPGSTLELYVDGDMFVGGNGQVNETGLPENLKIYGTAATAGGQTIKLHGNGIMHAAVFAPNANIELKGGGSSGEMSGSVIGNTVTMTGNYDFHYDECLEDASDGNPFAVASWRELNSAGERIGLY